MWSRCFSRKQTALTLPSPALQRLLSMFLHLPQSEGTRTGDAGFLMGPVTGTSMYVSPQIFPINPLDLVFVFCAAGFFASVFR